MFLIMLCYQTIIGSIDMKNLKTDNVSSSQPSLDHIFSPRSPEKGVNHAGHHYTSLQEDIKKAKPHTYIGRIAELINSVFNPLHEFFYDKIYSVNHN